jgi:CRISPR-associated protein Cpf1
MIPKCSTQLNSVKNHFQTETSDYILNDEKFNKPLVISKDIYDLNNPLDKGGKKKFQIEYFRQTGDEAGYKAAVKKWIMFCMDFLYSYKSTSIHDYSSLNPISKFDRVDKFYNEVNKLIYKVTFRTISEKYIRQLVLEGKLYLFQIYNKDFSSYSTGTPNMHTLYWKMLFDPLNLRDVVYKLDGQAEIFYRKSSIKKKDIIVHPSNNAIANKNKSNNKKKSTFNYDIIKDRRFTVDQYQFHVPITLNFKADAPGNINEMVNSFLKNSQNIYIIGIDRGERHLIYVSLIDEKGNIKKQFSLNDIVNEYKDNKYKTDYRGLLDSRESERDQARKDWKTIKTIKELKEGYLSQVIHKITRLMIEYKAIIVLEDLNTGFKRSRQKVEKQIYQKFEKMLIDKLNYLADKKTDPTKEGGILKAYQLSNKFESFQKMGKQSGFLFYVPAWNTSKIDSVTGFVNFFDTSYKNIDETKKFFEKFKSITFNKKENFFEFEVDDYSKFSGKAEGTRAEWVICTNGTRLESFRNQEKKSQWDSREIDLTEEFKKLFMGRIDIDKDIRTQVLEQEDKDFFERLLYLFRMTVQLRNSITGSDTDYILSPVPDKNGKFFDSRKAGPGLPDNADANGAYNIARKGLFLIEERIKEAEDMKKIDLSISNKDWLRFVQRNG